MRASCHFIFLMTLFAYVGCGKQSQNSKRPGAPGALDAVKTGSTTTPGGQDSAGRKGPGKEKTPPSNTTPALPAEPSLPPLAPSKLAWNGQTFVDSSNFALIPLE